MNLKNVTINSSAMIKRALLLDIAPIYPYLNGSRTSDTPTGYRYTVVMPAAGFEKLSVKIDGPQQIDTPANGPVEVVFDGLEMSLWTRNGITDVSATATGIHAVTKA